MNDPVVIPLQAVAPAVEGKKKHVKRTSKDISQRTRLIVQSLFIILEHLAVRAVLSLRPLL